MRYLSIVACCIVLAGCGSTKFQRVPMYSYDRDDYRVVQQTPPAGAEESAQVGDPLMRTSSMDLVPLIELQADHKHITKYRESLRMQITIPNGKLRLIGVDGAGGKFYRSALGAVLSYEEKGAFDSTEIYPGGVYIASGGATHIYWLWGEREPANISADSTITYKTGIDRMIPLKSGFQRELIYSGSSQGVITLFYREYVNDMVRPAFAQELKYDVAKGPVIGFKGARFEVLNADNTLITYRVAAPLPTAE
jgi:hypothetical protein